MSTVHDSYESAEEHDHARERDALTQRWTATIMGDRLRAEYAGEIDKPTPTIGQIPGGAGPLLYPGKVSGIAGDSGSGKSLMALAMARAEASTGGRTVWIDYEDSADTLAVRMAEMGWPVELGECVIHVQAMGHSHSAMDYLTDLIVTFDVRLVVIDSTGESLAGDGRNPNADEDVAAWFQDLPRPMANLGPAVLLIDHLVKDREGGLWPSGSHRKRDAVNGIQYIVRAGRPFSRATPGDVTLVCAKDRGGHHAQGERVVTVHFKPTAGVLHITATPAAPTPAKDSRTLTGYKRKVSEYLATHGPHSKSHLKGSAGLGKSAYVLEAINALIADGYVEESTSSNGRPAVTLVTAFAEDADA